MRPPEFHIPRIGDEFFIRRARRRTARFSSFKIDKTEKPSAFRIPSEMPCVFGCFTDAGQIPFERAECLKEFYLEPDVFDRVTGIDMAVKQPFVFVGKIGYEFVYIAVFFHKTLEYE